MKPPDEAVPSDGGFYLKDYIMKECCEHKFFWMLIDPESGKEYLAPLHCLYCPVCGTPLIPAG